MMQGHVLTPPTVKKQSQFGMGESVQLFSNNAGADSPPGDEEPTEDFAMHSSRAELGTVASCFIGETHRSQLK